MGKLREFGDAHCHLDLLPEAQFQSLYRLNRAGADAFAEPGSACRVPLLLSAGVWPSETRHALSGRFLQRTEFPFRCAVASGLHPVSVASRSADLERAIEELGWLAEDRLIDAIGETGFDLSDQVLRSAGVRGIGPSQVLDLQWQAARACLAVAARHRLPLVLHSRAAWAETCTLIETALHKAPELRIMIHCFPGSAPEAARLSRKGVYLSFGGVLTWKGSRRMKESIRVCERKRLLLETDAPDLAPELSEGIRPEINSPIYLPHIAQTAADLLGVAVDEIAQISLDNLQSFLGWTHDGLVNLERHSQK